MRKLILSLIFLLTAWQTLAVAEDEIAKAKALFDKVKKEDRYIDKLSFDNVYSLPLGLTRTIGGLEYTIIIDSIVTILPENGYINAYMAFDIPGQSQQLVFKGEKIPFNKTGLQGDAKLLLLSDQSIPIGNFTNTIIAKNLKTFVVWDCDGFKSFSLDGEITFSNAFVAEDENGKEAGILRATYLTSMTSWGDLLLTVNLPQFHLKNCKDFGFKVLQASLDLSEVDNPAGLSFPQGYHSPLYESGEPALWQGIYAKQILVRIPAGFKGGTGNAATASVAGTNTVSEKSTYFIAEDLVIDDQGVSGNFAGANLISYENGKISNWKCSLDSLRLRIIANQLQAASFKGRLHIPVLKSDKPSTYRASIDASNRYFFQLENLGQQEMPMLVATLQLDATSSVSVTVVDGSFFPKANLSGTLDIGTGSTSLADIRFENMQIQTIAPLVTIGACTFSSEKAKQAMANFPVAIEELGFKTKNNLAGIYVKCRVGLVGQTSGGFSGKAGFTVWGEQDNSSGFANWKYNSLQLNDIEIDIDAGAYKIHGGLSAFTGHPTFGDGFKGTAGATFKPGITVDVSTIFGTKEGNRYFYADAFVMFPKGIAIGQGLRIYAFSGGVYNHMRRELSTRRTFEQGTKVNVEGFETASGIFYVPDATSGIGIKASVVLGADKPEVFNGSVGFEIAFNARGGIRTIAFEGDGVLFTQLSYKRVTNAIAYANVLLQYNFDEDELYGNLFLRVDFKNVLEGRGAIEMYFSQKDWYIYAGTPQKRNHFSVIGLFSMDTYFMTGTQIPAMPLPPSEVMEVLRSTPYDTRDPLALSKGGGFAFGANARFGTGEKSFLIFYGRFDAGIGFDVMLKDYGTAVHCEGSATPIGMNGWYAQGQLYAYLQAVIGIKVNTTFYSGNFEILNFGAAALMQAKLPNPTWIKGTVGGHYNILNGLVSGNCKFELEIGEQCKINSGDALQGTKIIAQCTPANGEKKVDIFSAPQATFNMAVGREFTIDDINGNKRTFKAVMDYFKLTADGSEISGSHEWNNEKDVVAFKSTDILPGEKSLKLGLKIHFEEKINYQWQVLKKDGVDVVEINETVFETGPQPDYIPKQMIAYTYPIENQYNFYANEYQSGYIQLNKGGLTKPFQVAEGWKSEGRLTSTDGTSKLTFNYSYNTSGNEVTFTIPTGLSPNKVYLLELLKIPVAPKAAIDGNIKKDSIQKLNTDGNTAHVKDMKVEGTLQLNENITIYSHHFRTSKYDNFSTKYNSLRLSTGWNWTLKTGVDQIGVNVGTDEGFDDFEINGGAGFEPLVYFEADESNHWMNGRIKPVQYNNYPLSGSLYISWRNTDHLGIVPVKDIQIIQYPGNKQLSEQEIYSGTGSPITNFASFDYNLMREVMRDNIDLANKAARTPGYSTDPVLRNLLTTPIPNILSGNYLVNLKYRVPGKNQVTSVKQFNIRNP